MRRIGLWQQTRPDSEALESIAPFCHDTLTFEQWLQWVFLPKMKHVIETGEDFPTTSDIHPLAEYRFAQLPQQTTRLLDLIQQFDLLITRSS